MLFHNEFVSHVLGSQCEPFWHVCDTKIMHTKASQCETNTYETNTMWNKHNVKQIYVDFTLNVICLDGKKSCESETNLKVEVLKDLKEFGVLKWLSPYI